MSPAELVGAIVGGVVLLSFLVAGIVGLRNREAVRAALESAEAWQRERDAAVSMAERLAGELKDAKERIAKLEARVEELSHRPDLRELERLIERHEERAAERSERLIAAIDHLARKET